MPHAIAVQLHEVEAARPHTGDDIGQIVAHRRLAAGQLDVNPPARFGERVEPAVDFAQAEASAPSRRAEA